MIRRILTLNEMYEVYRYLQVPLQDIGKDTEFESFALSLMAELKNNPEFYLRILELFTGKTEDEIIRMTAQDALMEFLEGLRRNQVLRFHGFFMELSKDYGPF